MRLVTFRSLGTSTDGERIGVMLSDDRIIDLLAGQAALAGTGASIVSPTSLFSDMITFFAGGQAARTAAEEVVKFVNERIAEKEHPRGAENEPVVLGRADIQLLAPVPRPPRIRDYLTFESHAQGSGLNVPRAFYEMPICYKGNHLNVVGPDAMIPWPSYTEQLDYELELGFYIAKEGRNIPVERAAEYIAGATIFNDVSARDIQLYEMSMQIGPSKGKDFCNIMGPCAVTMDEINEFALRMTARVNGELWSEGTSARRCFSFAQVVAWASYYETIYPGEFIGVGTVGGGCGLELNRWIQPGDVVELEIEGIGTLRNTVGPKERPSEGEGLSTYTMAPPVPVAH